MRKVISEVVQLLSFLLVFCGLIVCMCEVSDLDKQMMTMGIGFGMMLVGAIPLWIASAKGEYE